MGKRAEGGRDSRGASLNAGPDMALTAPARRDARDMTSCWLTRERAKTPPPQVKEGNLMSGFPKIRATGRGARQGEAALTHHDPPSIGSPRCAP